MDGPADPAHASLPARSFVGTLARVQLWVAAFALVAMMLVTVADVTMRYLFNNPVRGTYDFTEVMLVVFVFHGMAACFLARANIVIDLIDGLVGARRSILQRFGDLIAFAMLLVFAWSAWTPATQAFGYGETKLQLGLPIWVLWVVALAGMAGSIVCAFWILIASNDRGSRDGASP
jgi:TRAP-type C4-dicarboxylate transport system permease small subunit